MNYQIISRKYRPQTFASIVGQEPTVITFKNALRSGKLAHAYLLCGCRGTGKTTFARILAKALNCAHLTEDIEPCNACPSCLDIHAGRSLDVLEIDGASNRGIDDIRNLNETVGYAPALGKYKIYIIDEVHMLTKEAFNALLKTLEEPPPHVKFFLATTEPHKILPTIISRCQRFDLSRIAPVAMIQKLKKITVDLHIECEEEVFHLISHLSEGSLRDAESLLDQVICSVEMPITADKLSSVLGLMPRRSFFAFDNAFHTQTLSFAFELAQDVFASGKDLAYFLDMLIEHYRTLLHVKLSQPLTIYGTDKERYKASALAYTEEQCLYILDYLIQWQQQLSKIPFKRIFLEMVLLHVLRSKYRLSSATLVKRLADLEHKLASNSPIAHTASANIEEEKQIQKSAPELKVEDAPQTQQILTSNNQEVNEETSSIPSSNQTEEQIVAAPVVYRNHLKNREFDKEPPQNFHLERATIVQAQGASEEENFEEKPTLSKPDFSSSFGINHSESKPTQSKTDIHPSRYQTLLQFAAIELEGTIQK